MPLFHLDNRDRNEETQRVYALFELIHTCVDFAAASCFIVGSGLFFWESTQTTATWLFVFGSILFAVKPSLRLLREMKLLRMGKLDTLAARASSD